MLLNCISNCGHNLSLASKGFHAPVSCLSTDIIALYMLIKYLLDEVSIH